MVEELNPLEEILIWYHSLDNRTKVDVVESCRSFHPAMSEHEYDLDVFLPEFEGYLKDQTLSPLEIIHRAFFIKALIDMHFHNRNTEAQLEEWRDRKQEYRQRFILLGIDPDAYTEPDESYYERKHSWLKAANSWKELTTYRDPSIPSISKGQLLKWYLFNKD
ncbi:hypothetical protein [Rufibacter quisquiliarum]|uniref:Uncharacterized protein n=1 Tax=Rufibacter quisquiliarum TaxID=1549639 RepID=A0A839GQA5_9BACT|nr:hypothetical protein [Rufibacter quisquiliarum]MBA9077077.1 hypothetical protein [Rufibacter quisquiliarum]